MSFATTYGNYVHALFFENLNGTGWGYSGTSCTFTGSQMIGVMISTMEFTNSITVHIGSYNNIIACYKMTETKIII